MAVSGQPTTVVHLVDSMRIDHGGPVTVVTELAREQASMGMRVYVSTNWAELGQVDREALDHRWQGIGVCPLETKRVELARLFKKFGGDIMLHAHGVWGQSVVTACGIARRCGTPWVVSTHGMLHPRALSHHRWRKTVFLTLNRSTILNAAHLLVLNDAEADEVLRLSAGRPEVLSNGVDPSCFDDGDQGVEFRKLCPKLEGRPYVLFVGRIHPIKGIDALVRAFAGFRSRGITADLVIAGPDDGARSAAVNAARQSHLSDHVHFPGRISGDFRRSAYSGCRVFAHRPVYEGFGLSVIEALAAGRPVVTTRRCELDGQGAGDFLTWAPDTDDGFGNALDEVFARSTDSPDRAAQGWVRVRYSWRAIAAQANNAYTRVKLAAKGC